MENRQLLFGSEAKNSGAGVPSEDMDSVKGIAAGNPPSQAQKRQTACITTIKDVLEGSYVKEGGWTPNYIQFSDGRKVSRINIICAVVFVDESNQLTITVDDGTGSMSVRSFDETSPIKNISVGDTITLIGRPREFGTQKYIIPEIIKKTSSKWVLYRKKELDLISVLFPSKNVTSTNEIISGVHDLPKNSFSSTDKRGILDMMTRGVDSSAVNRNAFDKNAFDRNVIDKNVIDRTVIEEESVEEELFVSQDFVENNITSSVRKDKTSAEIVFELIKNLDTGIGADIQEVVDRSNVSDAEKIITSMISNGDIFEVRAGRVKIL